MKNFKKMELFTSDVSQQYSEFLTKFDSNETHSGDFNSIIDLLSPKEIRGMKVRSWIFLFDENDVYIGYTLITTVQLSSGKYNFREIIQLALVVNAHSFCIISERNSILNRTEYIDEATEQESIFSLELEEICKHVNIKFVNHYIVNSANPRNICGFS